MLKAREKTVFEVDGADLEHFIKETYGRGIEIVADQEWSNNEMIKNVSKSCTVKKGMLVPTGVLASYDQEKFDKWKDGGHVGYVLDTILEQMANEGHIQPGEYVIDVRW